MPGNSASSRAKRKELASRAGRSPRAAGFCNAAVKAGSIGYEPEQHPTLRAGSNLASTGAVIQKGVLCMASGQANAEVGEDVGTTLSARQYKDPPITIVTRCGCDGGGKGALASENASLTLSTRNEQSLFDPNDGPRYIVRRLMPTECERLQGFPDGWTDVPDFDGKPTSDAQRYKQLGNSMSVPVMRWIGKRILMVDEKEDER